MRLAVISSRASVMLDLMFVWGASLPLLMTSLTWVSSFLPKLPPGCDLAKSSGLKPLASSRATAKASPIASAAVVLAVGAKLSGHASFSTRTLRCESAKTAKEESGLPVRAISLAPVRLIIGTIAVSSLVSPELENATNTSCCVTMPRSPWLASAG